MPGIACGHFPEAERAWRAVKSFWVSSRSSSNCVIAVQEMLILVTPKCPLALHSGKSLAMKSAPAAMLELHQPWRSRMAI